VELTVLAKPASRSSPAPLYGHLHFQGRAVWRRRREERDPRG